MGVVPRVTDEIPSVLLLKDQKRLRPLAVAPEEYALGGRSRPTAEALPLGIVEPLTKVRTECRMTGSKTRQVDRK